ncbi:MAG TPA: asparaginase [Candidatus Obscuribacterales bacterium]
MTRAKRYQTAELEVQLLREGIIESVHTAHAVVCDSRGRMLSVAGNAETATFIRSSLKPFQALTVAAAGTLERFGLDDRDLAIMCASHQGQMEQVRQAFHILWKAELEPRQLQCPIPPGGKSPLEHNCSGKHAGMLALCQQRNWPLESYLHRNHPLQVLILQTVADLLGMPADEFIGAHDDCGAPTYLMPLNQMASLFAKLTSGDNLEMERIVRAMTHHPELVAGPDAFDTEVMRLTEGGVVSKSGAEGIQCIARVGQGMGLAIKVRDGAKRAKHAVAVHLLKQLGWLTPEVAEELADKYMVLSAYKRLDVQGDLDLM